MKSRSTSFVTLAVALLTSACALGQQPARAVPQGVGQLETPPALFKAGVDEQGRAFLLNGQPAQNGKLILTSSNGFFTPRTCRAVGESALPKVGDENLIKPNFECLSNWNSTEGTIRWHVWIPEPGTVRLNFNMRIARAAAGSEIVVSLGRHSQSVVTKEATPQTPQPWNLAFDIAEAGQHTIVLTASKIAAPARGVGELHTIDLFGPAIHKAQLLRARWRPMAVHAGYGCSTIPQSRMWVVTTRSTCDFSSYSPITTPFGYFGTSFSPDRRSTGNFNFSMWAAGAKGKVPSLNHMPHLLAAGSPNAQFSGFGHEGSGVKLRGWMPMPDRPRVCVQALRVEPDGNYDTYHGYFWDHPSRRWKLYAVGRKWNGGKPQDDLTLGSFCEIPGPSQIQRTGDQVREVRRRGWFYSDDQQWHAMDTFKCRSKAAANKSWRTTGDGEFAMATGGMRYYSFTPPTRPAASKTLPEFLTPAATRQLFELAARFAESGATATSKTSARLNIAMADAGNNAQAEVFYGEVDCLTFAKRKLHGTERNSKVSNSTQDANRSWQNSVVLDSLKDGTNLITLSNLKPGTTYFYRTLVTNDEGKIWSFETRSFRTR